MANQQDVTNSDGCPSRSSSAMTTHGPVKMRRHGTTNTKCSKKMCGKWGEKSSWRGTGIHWTVIQSREGWWSQLFEYHCKTLSKSSRSKDQHCIWCRHARQERRLDQAVSHSCNFWAFVQRRAQKTFVCEHRLRQDEHETHKGVCSQISRWVPCYQGWKSSIHHIKGIDPRRRRRWSWPRVLWRVRTLGRCEFEHLRILTGTSRPFSSCMSQSAGCWSIGHSWHTMVMWLSWMSSHSMMWQTFGQRHLPQEWDGLQQIPERSQATKSLTKWCANVNTQMCRYPCKSLRMWWKAW